MMYVKEAGVRGHQKMEKLFMKEAENCKDMEAKSFASNTLPTVKMHWQMANDLMMKWKGVTNGGMSNMKSGRNESR